MTEQQPSDAEAYAGHPDLDDAATVDDHGPAFERPPDPEADDE